MLLQEKIDKYLNSMALQKPKTLKWKQQKLETFLLYVQNEFGVLRVQDLGEDHMNKFFLHLQKRELANATLRGYRTAISHFLRKLERLPELQGIRERLLGGLPKFKRERRVVEALFKEEVDVLLSTISDEHDFALVSLLLGTGVRAGECIHLQVGDIDMRSMMLIVRRAGYGQQGGSKGGHERVVPIGPTLKSTLADYIGFVRPRRAHNGTKWLFLSPKGEQLSTDRLYWIVRGWLEEAGIEKEQMGPHLLRRTYASLLMEGGLSDSEVAARLGHDPDVAGRVVKQSYATDRAQLKALKRGPDVLAAHKEVYHHRYRR